MGAEIITTFTDALSSLASGVASTVVTTFDTVMTNSEGKLSNLAIYGIVTIAVSLGIGLVRKFSAKAG